VIPREGIERTKMNWLEITTDAPVIPREGVERKKTLKTKKFKANSSGDPERGS